MLKNVIEHAKGRVIIASFASHIHRMQQICDAAVANGRKVVVTGRSMIQNTDIARKLGYLHIKDDDLIDAYELKDIPPNEVVIMCTGSQGEPLSALGRIANGEHKTIDIEPGDTVIISATPVPGNEKAVTKVVNSLAKMGVDVYDKSRGRVHVSGHASAEELKLVLAMVQPSAFAPVHGEATHLRAHAKLAEVMGVDPDEIYILENGDTLVMKDGVVSQGEGVQSGIVYVDGLSVGDTSQSVLDERVELGSMGIASVSVAISFARKVMIGNPVVEMRGITGGDADYLSREAARVVTNAVQTAMRGKDITVRLVRKAARDAVSNMLWNAVKQRPMIVVNVLEV
jgi:ribonuclease J